MRYSPKEAAKYAISCNIKMEIFGMPVEDYVKKCDLEEKRKSFKEEQIKNEVIKKEKEIDKELKTDYD
jgi:hypothetical protein